MSEQTDFNCCDLCHNLKIGDLITIGLGTTSVIIGSITNKVCSNDCENLIISATSISINGLNLELPEETETVPVTVCCRDINMIIKSLSTLY